MSAAPIQSASQSCTGPRQRRGSVLGRAIGVSEGGVVAAGQPAAVQSGQGHVELCSTNSTPTHRKWHGRRKPWPANTAGMAAAPVQPASAAGATPTTNGVGQPISTNSGSATAHASSTMVALSAWGCESDLHQQAQHPCSHPSPRVVQSVQASQRWLRLHKFKSGAVPAQPVMAAAPVQPASTIGAAPAKGADQPISASGGTGQQVIISSSSSTTQATYGAIGGAMAARESQTSHQLFNQDNLRRAMSSAAPSSLQWLSVHQCGTNATIGNSAYNSSNSTCTGVKAARWALPNQRRLIPHSPAVQHRPSQGGRQLVHPAQLARLVTSAMGVVQPLLHNQQVSGPCSHHQW